MKFYFVFLKKAIFTYVFFGLKKVVDHLTYSFSFFFFTVFNVKLVMFPFQILTKEKMDEL